MYFKRPQLTNEKQKYVTPFPVNYSTGYLTLKINLKKNLKEKLTKKN